MTSETAMNETFRRVQEAFQRDFTQTSLRVVITLWALFIIALAWIVDNNFLLAGILAYEVLP